MKQDTIPPRNYNTCRLSNGLRIIHLPSASPAYHSFAERFTGGLLRLSDSGGHP